MAKKRPKSFFDAIFTVCWIMIENLRFEPNT
jgi:hypothetical protein